MTVESVTYINDFDTSLPTSTDTRSQGDDHIRNIKSALKTTFPGGTRVFPIPTTLSKSADYTVVRGDGESTIYVNTTSGAVSLTLPALVAADQGWKVHVIKTNSGANPIFLVPPSGTINSGGVSGLSKARRAIPGVRITAIWDGSGYFVTRAHSLPIGSVITFDGASLPAGFEWPNGQTLSSALNYPEYNSVMGTLITKDHRGRVDAGKDDMGGVSANRLTNLDDGLDGDVLGAVGGVEVQSLVTSNLPPYTPSGSVTSTSTLTTATTGNAGAAVSGALGVVPSGSAANTITSTFTGVAQGGTSSAFGVLQPTIVSNKLLVVE